MPHRLSPEAYGVYVISVTPFTDAGVIDWDGIGPLADFYLGAGVHGVTILGMMGEAAKLSESESEHFVRRYVDAVAGRVPVVVGVSNAGVDNQVRLSRVAMDAGACGVMVAPVPTLKTDEQIIAYFSMVTECLGPDVPVVYQDYPQSTGADISVEAFVRLVDQCPSIVMLKHEDWPGLRKLSRIRRLCDGQAHRRVSILVGNGGLFLPQELRRGADGAMTGFAYPEMLVEVCRTARAGHFDDAEALFNLYLPLVRYEQQPGIGMAIRKEILRRRGVLRSAALREPGGTLADEDRHEISGMMAALDVALATSSPARTRAPAMAGDD